MTQSVHDNLDLCQTTFIHEDAIHQAQAHLPDPDSIDELAEFFKILGDPTRMKILLALLASELCVCDIAATLGQTASAISHQLRLLKAHALVRNRKVGRVVYYALNDDHVATILHQGHVHLSEGREV